MAKFMVPEGRTYLGHELVTNPAGKVRRVPFTFVAGDIVEIAQPDKVVNALIPYFGDKPVTNPTDVRRKRAAAEEARIKQERAAELEQAEEIRRQAAEQREADRVKEEEEARKLGQVSTNTDMKVPAGDGEQGTPTPVKNPENVSVSTPKNPIPKKS